MENQTIHRSYCYAGQPAACSGYFENDVLPCICDAPQNVIAALQKLQVTAAPVHLAEEQIKCA